MHIPDGYLGPITCAAGFAVMAPVWAIAANRVKKTLLTRQVPLLAIGAAFSFVIMMFNIPIPGGTTGHAVGAVLIAILLGPWAATIAVTVSLTIQALLFGDGGITALGANCFNMAFVLPFLGYYVYRFITDRVSSEKGNYFGIIAGSYFGINAAALCAAIEFGIQPLLFTNAAGLPLYCPYPLSVSIPAMVIPHLIVAGAVEAVFTVFIYTFIKQVSPGTIYEGAKKKTKAVYGLIAALICLTPLGLLATGTAWGEWGSNEIKSVASGGQTLGFTPPGMIKGFRFEALLPDYAVSGLPGAAGYILAAVFGAAILIIAFKIISSFKKDQIK